MELTEQCIDQRSVGRQWMTLSLFNPLSLAGTFVITRKELFQYCSTSSYDRLRRGSRDPPKYTAMPWNILGKMWPLTIAPGPTDTRSHSRKGAWMRANRLTCVQGAGFMVHDS